MAVKLGHSGKMASSLMTLERTCLREIYRPECKQGAWKIKRNLELQNANKSLFFFVSEIEIRRLEWLGNIITMEDTCIPKMILNTKPGARRGLGRPKL
jgi:hypothetical protein